MTEMATNVSKESTALIFRVEVVRNYLTKYRVQNQTPTINSDRHENFKLNSDD
jgi:hypothetical protein